MPEKTTILEADDFPNDWYGWVTNQISHIGLGVFLVFVVCLSSFGLIGEMPYKNAVYALVLFGYLSFEMGVQGWREWDTLEDTAFVTFYGAGGALAGFSEVTPGDAMLTVNPLGLMPFFAVAVLHLLAGALFRR
jgi:hypothetical protein